MDLIVALCYKIAMAKNLTHEQRLIGYVRVSTQEQNVDLQVQALRKFGVPKDDLWIEKKSAVARERPELDGAIASLREGDTLVVWRLDRIARSMAELYRRIAQIDEAGARFKSLTEGFDFSDISGKLILAVLGAVAEFERNLIAQRTTAGIAAAKARGQTFGRKPVMTDAKREKAHKLLLAGHTTAEVAKAIGVKQGLIYKYFKVDKRADGSIWITEKEV